MRIVLRGYRSLAVRVLLLAIAAWLGALPSRAASPSPDDNWPQWRGPTGMGVAPTADPPVTWSETNNIRWKVKLPGAGTATPIVWEDRVFIQTAVATGRKVEQPPGSPPSPPAADATRQPPQRGGFGNWAKPVEAFQFTLLCLDRRSGKTLWQRVAREEVPHEAHHPDHAFASYSPVTDGKYIVAFFGSRGLHCYDMQGNPKWQKDFGKMRTKMSFGEGASPAVYGSTVVVNWDHEGDDFIAAFDVETGNELWRQPRQEDTSWSTPLIVRHEGQTQVVTAAMRRIRGYDLSSGKLIWECGGLTANVIPSPVAGDGMVYATSGFRGSALLAIRLGRSGDLTGTDAVAWTHGKNTPYVPSPLLYNGRLYFFASNNGTLSCFDAKSGRPMIDARRLDDLDGVYASPVAASGRVYLVGRNGVTVVIRSSDNLDVLATNRLDDRIDASPAVAGGDLFLRGHEHLYCIAAK